ncbi:7578_t:CDS:1 [Diversispora eburnea]|uniref:7578_t:CDS:1 n=1 Tax=Diversispora eburnea TaxID=1213867 RepID=A0A9N9BFQ9_9GLOM|nr:7578_t:CDS:1 [Diversispora eburnea]
MNLPIIYKDISYIPNSTNSQQTLDLIIPPFVNKVEEEDDDEKSLLPPIIVIIHGGAWVSGDKNDFTTMGHNLCESSHFAIAIVNYRLSTKENPEIKHPIHVQDVASSIYWISQHGKEYGFQETMIYLAGHSVGAFISGQLIFIPEFLDSHNPKLSEYIKGVIGIQGIYDVYSLFQIWPEYIKYIEPAFGKDELFYKKSSLTNNNIKGIDKIPPYLIIHSKEDELVDVNQSYNYYLYLKNCGGINIEFNTSLKGNHEGILQTEELLKVIIEFIVMSELNVKDWNKLMNETMDKIKFDL